MEEEKEMNNSNPQKEMQISGNGNYAGKNANIISLSSSQLPCNGPTTPSTMLEDQRAYKKVVVKYKECLKNHAAAIGGNATDGCGEFMPSGEEGSLEALKCSACNCHRNFHRKEIDGECLYDSNRSLFLHHPSNRLILGHPNGIIPQGYPINSLVSSKVPAHHQMIVSYKGASVPSESDERDDDNGGGLVPIRPVDQKLRKRFRTKFTEVQKAKMFNFAEQAGWKMQKLEESVVQKFCQELGIKRKVLKVWMHNNKHNFAKKNPSI